MPVRRTAAARSSLGKSQIATNQAWISREDAIRNERARIAAEIHDTFLQGLTAIVLQLEITEHEFVECPAKAYRRLGQLREIARASLDEARRSMWAFSQNSFDNEDPAAALTFLAGKLFVGSGTALQLSLEKGACVKLKPASRFAVMRIGKEALNNVLKHARATMVRVELSCDEHEARLSVLDNGCGFAAPQLSSSLGGFGILSIHARAESVGGKVEIHSRPAKGTRVTATVPFAGSQQIGLQPQRIRSSTER